MVHWDCMLPETHRTHTSFPLNLRECSHCLRHWGTIFMKEGAEMDCPLQAVHLCSLKHILGCSKNNTTLSKVLQADVEMSSLSREYWTWHGLGKVQHISSLSLVWAAYYHEGVRCWFEKKAERCVECWCLGRTR
eukprot:1144556-Pelagomonas_calceolata.AAC.1